MKKPVHRAPAPYFCILLLFLTSAHAGGEQHYYEKHTDKSLSAILEDTEFAITEHNLRIVDRLHLGQAIRKRGNPQFPDFEIILYCNLTFAEKMLALDPGLINLCPGRITIRSVNDAYIISAPLWPEENDNIELNKLMHGMNNIVSKIVDYAAEDWLTEGGE